MNIAKIMKQAQDMQGRMQKIQQEVAAQSFDGVSGGGAVKVIATGDGNLTSVTITPEAIASGDAELLGEMVVAAANAAIEKGRQVMQQKASSLTAGLGIPGF